MSDAESPTPAPRATSIGETGGLPGRNADPRAAELDDDTVDDTVLMGEVAPPDPGEDTERPSRRARDE